MIHLRWIGSQARWVVGGGAHARQTQMAQGLLAAQTTGGALSAGGYARSRRPQWVSVEGVEGDVRGEERDCRRREEKTSSEEEREGGRARERVQAANADKRVSEKLGPSLPVFFAIRYVTLLTPDAREML